MFNNSYAGITVCGRIGKDAEIKERQGGRGKFAVFSIATSTTWKDADGSKTEKTTWFDCIMGGDKRADFAREWLKKGKMVAVQGTPTIRTYDKDGETRKAFQITVNEVTFLPGGAKKDSEGDGGDTKSNDSFDTQF